MKRTYQGGKVVDGDHGHSRVTLSDVNLDRWLWERGVDSRIDRDRIVRVGGASRKISHKKGTAKAWKLTRTKRQRRH